MTNSLITIENHIAHLQLARPEKANALNEGLWNEIRESFLEFDKNDEVRVIILSAQGKHFCAGIDLAFLMEVKNSLKGQDPARQREHLRKKILEFQECFNTIERCQKPVLAAIHSTCIGGGVDLVSACDMRYASADAFFSIKEIDIGMTADVGTLQRLPHLIPQGVLRELAYTGRNVTAEEALKLGFVNQVFENQESLNEGVKTIAQTIAQKSPLAIRGTKEMLLYARDHSVADSLNYVATWNASMLLSDDLIESAMAKAEKRMPQYEN